MYVHVIASLRNFEEDASYLYIIKDAIRDSRYEIAFDWISGVEGRRKRSQNIEETFDWEELVESNIEAIKASNAVIVEGSRYNYSQGYQTAVALQLQKPVLNLYRKDLQEHKQWPDKLFVSGISNPLFVNKSYDDKAELTAIIDDFLRALPTKDEV